MGGHLSLCFLGGPAPIGSCNQVSLHHLRSPGSPETSLLTHTLAPRTPKSQWTQWTLAFPNGCLLFQGAHQTHSCALQSHPKWYPQKRLAQIVVGVGMMLHLQKNMSLQIHPGPSRHNLQWGTLRRTSFVGAFVSNHLAAFQIQMCRHKTPQKRVRTTLETIGLRKMHSK